MKKRAIVALVLLYLFISSLFGQSFGKNKVQVEKSEWSVIETLHFDIYYPKGADDFGRTMSLLAEEAYFYLQDAFQTPIEEKIPIIFYQSHLEFQVTNIIYPLLTEGVGGFTESLRNRVVVPYDGSYKKLEEILIHELTHAYENALDSDLRAARFFNVPRMSLPFWFQEGLPEYLAIGGGDNYNNMFVMDMIFNSYLQPLDRIGGYYAYRLGESFLTYIDDVYGREMVMRYFYAVRNSNSIDKATERIFGMDFSDLQLRWRNYLNRKYTPYLQTHNVPYEIYEQRTDHIKDGSFLNYAPRFSPDGEVYLYFSNRDQRMSIWLGHDIDIFAERLILRGETTGRFEQFHFQRKNISWFPDGQQFAFVAKTKAGDVIYIMDADSRKIVRSLEMFDFEAIYEIDVCSQGELLAFSGQREMKNNIYYLDLSTREVVQLTDDPYYDHQPRWSPDRSKIAFTSERTEIPEHRYEHVFNRLTNQIYLFDLVGDEFHQVTFDDYSNHSPFWNSSGEKLLFISEQDNIANFHLIDLQENQRAEVTRTLTGVFSGDLKPNDSSLIFSAFYNNGWNIYYATDPLSNLDYQDYQQPQLVELKDDFYERFSLYRFRYFGREERSERRERREERNNLVRDESGAFFRVNRNVNLHQRPTVINEPEIQPYRIRFFLDRLWGGMAYSSAYGTMASLQIGLSDIMGDHTIGIQLGIAGKIKDSDFMVSYTYLPRRIDVGFGAFSLTDEAIFRDRDTNNQAYYIYRREKDTGGFVLLRYPFNRFWRLDFENVLLRRNELYEFWDEKQGQWEEFENRDDLIYQPRLSLVHDNVLYGITGPMSGWRGHLSFNRSFAQKENNYATVYGDLRNYLLFAKRYSLATKIVAGASSGDRPQSFRLDGQYGIRGFTEPRRGHKKSVATVELRFPFIDRLDMRFPLPLSFHQIRGSLFTDFGAVWNNFEDFRGVREGKLEDLVLGFGFGPRFNLGFFIFKLDIAWSTDLSGTGRPNYFISINEDF